MRDEDGVRRSVEVPKRVRAWWWNSDNGKIATIARCGARVVELANAKRVCFEKRVKTQFSEQQKAGFTNFLVLMKLGKGRRNACICLTVIIKTYKF